ncbi:MAG: ribosome small subunit-dependent GTPase A [Alcaligenaceae bacterium]|nr:ribosome small subunit-dependent GTPase A [Alcaligenaceae bacterium]
MAKALHLSKKNRQKKADQRAGWMPALVVSTYGRHYEVMMTADLPVDEVERSQEIPQNRKMLSGCVTQAYTRGKKLGVCVGDRVLVSEQSDHQVCIEEVLMRDNLLYRSDQMRSKQFAANIDQLFFVVGVVPTFSEDLLGRALTAARSAGIDVWIILNKIDQVDRLEEAQARIGLYSDLGFKVIQCSAKDEQTTRDLLLPLMQNKTNLMLGQSAMGKTTLLNALIPSAQAYTQDYSEALDAGKHTTTNTHLYELEGGGYLIDSPGFQQFGLLHLDRAQIVEGFPEFEPANPCRFYDCTHQHEPACGVLSLLEQGKIHQERYDLYVRLVNDILN